MLCGEAGVLPGSDYYLGNSATDGIYNSKLHYQMLRCGHYHCVRGYLIDRQYYDSLLVCYVLDGMLELRYQGEQYSITPGAAMVIDCRQPQYYAAGEHLEFLWAHFTGGNCGALFEDIYSRCGPLIRNENTPLVRETLASIISAYRNDQAPSAASISSSLFSILCHLYPGQAVAQGYDAELPVNRAIDYMRFHLPDPISIDDVAAEVHMSKHYFSRSFRQKTGMSPHEYLIKLRLDMAKHLLATTHDTVRDIAYRVGYRSEMGLTMAFSDKVGIPPGKYRHFVEQEKKTDSL